MRAGKLRHVVQYQTYTEVANSLGKLVKTWSTAATFRAEVRSPYGSELVNAEQLKAIQARVVVIRHPGYPLDPKFRLVWGSVVLQIQSSLDPDGRRRQLNVSCTELVS